MNVMSGRAARAGGVAPAPGGGAPPRVASGPPECRVVALRSLADAERYREEWQALAANAVEANVFYEPWNLLPALDTIAADSRVTLLFVFLNDGEAEVLAGFFPLEAVARYKGVRIRHHRLLQHLHCFLCTPLVHAAYRERALAAFADWAAVHACRPLLVLDRISGTLREPLARALATRLVRVRLTDTHQRAVYRPDTDARRYLERAIPKKFRKEYRRLLRRLSETGDVEFRCLAHDADAEPWIEAFLGLERRGWKGRARTALACTPEGRRYFEAVARAAHEAGRLQMIGCFRGEQPIALSCKFSAGDGVFAFKIAYDERYRRYSPGTLLELEYIDRTHGQRALRWMDSCANADHFMANRLWRDRRRVETLVAAGSMTGRVLLWGLLLLRRPVARVRAIRGAPRGGRS